MVFIIGSTLEMTVLHVKDVDMTLKGLTNGSMVNTMKTSLAGSNLDSQQFQTNWGYYLDSKVLISPIHPRLSRNVRRQRSELNDQGRVVSLLALQS